MGSAPSPVSPKPSPKDVEKNDEALGVISADTFERANEFIEDQINDLDWKQMQELVAGILRAMGYRTTVSEPGPDRGVDVFASRDGLGLEEPRDPPPVSWTPPKARRCARSCSWRRGKEGSSRRSSRPTQ
jgi:restriction system protein